MPAMPVSPQGTLSAGSETPQYTFLEIPRYSPGFAAATRLWHRTGRSLVFTAAGNTWALTTDAAICPAIWKIRIYIRFGDHELTVFLDSTALADWADSGMDVHTLFSLPPDLAGPALELVLLETLAALETTTGRPISFMKCNMNHEEVWLPDEAPGEYLPFTLRREGREGIPPLVTHGAIAAPDSCLEELAVLFFRFTKATNHTPGMFPLRDFPLRGRILLTGPTVRYEDLRGLETGDILLTGLSPPADTEGFPVRFAFPGGLGAAARHMGTQLYMECGMTRNNAPDAETPKNMPMETATQESKVRAGISPDPRDITVALTFDLGSLEISLAELAEIAPGRILETGRAAASPVFILASGRRIGTGDLVNVGGMLGVRVLSLHFGNPADETGA
jgi:type III secretion system YscQ/HrcQ family protein